jgi:hypothetical protein
VIVLDLYASREHTHFDINLAGLVSLLVSAKFVQMKYPSAESLNSATDNSYSYEMILQMEAHLLDTINWELL